MPRVPPSRCHDHSPDRNEAAIMYQIGLSAFDHRQRRWPGADYRPPNGEQRRLRVRAILERAGMLKAKER